MSNRLTVGECMVCRKQGSTPVYNVNGAAVSMCDACREKQIEAERAEKECHLLAEWGTVAERRAS